MNGYQFFTLLTLATAGVIGLAGIAFAYLILAGSPRLATYGVPPVADDSRLLVAVLVGAAGLVAASMVVKAQQAVMGVLLERMKRQVSITYREVEEALGTEAANAWLEVWLAKKNSQIKRHPWLARLFG